MFCRNCGETVADAAVVCPKCGVATGVPMPTTAQPIYKSRIAYILLGLFLGFLGIHNFYAGYHGRAVSQLLICVLTGWLIIPLLVVGIWIIAEVCSVDRDADNRPMV